MAQQLCLLRFNLIQGFFAFIIITIEVSSFNQNNSIFKSFTNESNSAWTWIFSITDIDDASYVNTLPEALKPPSVKPDVRKPWIKSLTLQTSETSHDTWMVYWPDGVIEVDSWFTRGGIQSNNSTTKLNSNSKRIITQIQSDGIGAADNVLKLLANVGTRVTNLNDETRSFQDIQSDPLTLFVPSTDQVITTKKTTTTDETIPEDVTIIFEGLDPDDGDDDTILNDVTTENDTNNLIDVPDNETGLNPKLESTTPSWFIDVPDNVTIIFEEIESISTPGQNDTNLISNTSSTLTGKADISISQGTNTSSQTENETTSTTITEFPENLTIIFVDYRGSDETMLSGDVLPIKFDKIEIRSDANINSTLPIENTTEVNDLGVEDNETNNVFDTRQDDLENNTETKNKGLLDLPEDVTIIFEGLDDSEDSSNLTERSEALNTGTSSTPIDESTISNLDVHVPENVTIIFEDRSLTEVPNDTMLTTESEILTDTSTSDEGLTIEFPLGRSDTSTWNPTSKLETNLMPSPTMETPLRPSSAIETSVIPPPTMAIFTRNHAIPPTSPTTPMPRKFSDLQTVRPTVEVSDRRLFPVDADTSIFTKRIEELIPKRNLVTNEPRENFEPLESTPRLVYEHPVEHLVPEQPLRRSEPEQPVEYFVPERPVEYVAPEREWPMEYFVPERPIEYFAPERPMEYFGPVQERPMEYFAPERPLEYFVPEQGRPMKYFVPEQGRPMEYFVPEQGRPMEYLVPEHERPMEYLVPEHERPMEYLVPEHERPKEYLVPEHERPMEYLVPEHERRMEYLVPEHERRMEYLVPEHERRMEYLVPEHERRMEYLVPEHERRMEYLVPEHERRMEYLVPEHERRLEYLVPEHERPMEYLVPEHERPMEYLVPEHERPMEYLVPEHERPMEYLVPEHERPMEYLVPEHERRMEYLVPEQEHPPMEYLVPERERPMEYLLPEREQPVEYLMPERPWEHPIEHLRPEQHIGLSFQPDQPTEPVIRTLQRPRPRPTFYEEPENQPRMVAGPSRGGLWVDEPNPVFVRNTPNIERSLEASIDQRVMIRPCVAAGDCDASRNERCVTRGDVRFCDCGRTFFRDISTGKCLAHHFAASYSGRMPIPYRHF